MADNSDKKYSTCPPSVDTAMTGDWLTDDLIQSGEKISPLIKHLFTGCVTVDHRKQQYQLQLYFRWVTPLDSVKHSQKICIYLQQLWDSSSPSSGGSHLDSWALSTGLWTSAFDGRWKPCSHSARRIVFLRYRLLWMTNTGIFNISLLSSYDTYSRRHFIKRNQQLSQLPMKWFKFMFCVLAGKTVGQ